MTTVWHLRVGKNDVRTFRKRCEEEFNRKPNDMLRDLIHAFNQGRLTITPTEAQENERRTLYHES